MKAIVIIVLITILSQGMICLGGNDGLKVYDGSSDVTEKWKEYVLGEVEFLECKCEITQVHFSSKAFGRYIITEVQIWYISNKETTISPTGDWAKDGISSGTSTRERMKLKAESRKRILHIMIEAITIIETIRSIAEQYGYDVEIDDSHSMEVKIKLTPVGYECCADKLISLRYNGYLSDDRGHSISIEELIEKFL